MPNPNGTYGYQLNPLKAQKAWTGEIGSRGKWDRFSWDVTYYYSQIWDELLKFNANPTSGIYSTTFNAPKTVHQGIELGGGVEVLRDLSRRALAMSVKISQIWNMNLFAFNGDRIYGNNWLPVAPAPCPAHDRELFVKGRLLPCASGGLGSCRAPMSITRIRSRRPVTR